MFGYKRHSTAVALSNHSMLARCLSFSLIFAAGGCAIDGKDSDTPTTSRVVTKGSNLQTSGAQGTSDAKAAPTEYVLPIGIAPNSEKFEIRQVGENSTTSGKVIWSCATGTRDDKPKFVCHPGEQH